MLITPSSARTRPANVDAYAAGDLVANSTTVGSVSPFTFDCSGFRARGIFSGNVLAAKLVKSTVTATLATFMLHLFDRVKTLTNGDNGAFVVSNMDGWLGAISLDLATGATAVAGGPLAEVSANVLMPFELQADSLLYGYLVAAAAYVPASAEVFTIGLSIES